MLLAREREDNEFAQIQRKIRREGVTDDDIRWFWNRHDIERRVMDEYRNFCGFVLFRKFREEGLDAASAVRAMRTFYPFFGDPEDTSHAEGEDRPLPYELVGRTDSYILRRQLENEAAFTQELQKASSCNAFLRKEIAQGRLDRIQPYEYQGKLVAPILWSPDGADVVSPTVRTLDKFALAIREQEHLLFGTWLFICHFSTFHAKWHRMIEFDRKQYAKIKERCERKIARAKELLCEAEYHPESIHNLNSS